MSEKKRDMFMHGMMKLGGLAVICLISSVVHAAGLTPAQLSVAGQLSPQEQLDLANQAGIQLPNTGIGQPEDFAYPEVVKQDKRDTEDVRELSAIERSIQDRLQTKPSYKSADETVADETVADETVADETVAGRTWDAWLAEGKDQAIKPVFQFGYDLFSGTPTTFAPVTEIPVPAEYVMGPGDELQLQFYGQRNNSLQMVVDRSGMIELPEIGPVRLAGLKFHEAKASIAEVVRQKSIGVTVAVSMGELRSMRVFVLGDVKHPGSYLVSSLSTMSNALFVSGGISKQGSLRVIRLKRQGKTIATLDLYDFLLRGDSRQDKRLLPGDVVFVAPIGKTIVAHGEVNRPAIYELNQEKTVADIVGMAGGLTAHADAKHQQVDRINARGDRVLIDLKPAMKLRIQAGDMLRVHAVPALAEQQVELLGEVKRPGSYGYVKGMRLNDLLAERNDLLQGAFTGLVLIQHTDVIDGSVSVERLVLKDLFAAGQDAIWPELQANDRVFVFSQQLLSPQDHVRASGEFMKPGTYPLGKTMDVLNLVLAAGGPTDKAYLKEVEITRFDVQDDTKRVAQRIQVNLLDILAGSVEGNMILQAYDEVLIRKISQWHDVARVRLEGEVVFPSEYPIEKGEKLASLLQRAGGFTDKAYLKGAVFMRESIRKQQQTQLDTLVGRMETEISQMESSIALLSNASVVIQKQKGLEAAKRVLEQMKATKAQGRLVIKLKDIMLLEKSEFNLALRDGDKLYVPQKPDQVLVLGQVYNTTALLYRRGFDLDDYVQAAGGVMRMADEKRMYVVRVNGQLERVKTWGRIKIHPGDTIVVPEELEQFNLLDSTLDWSKVLMQMGVGLAGFQVIGIF